MPYEVPSSRIDDVADVSAEAFIGADDAIGNLRIGQGRQPATTPGAQVPPSNTPADSAGAGVAEPGSVLVSGSGSSALKVSARGAAERPIRQAAGCARFLPPSRSPTMCLAARWKSGQRHPTR